MNEDRFFGPEMQDLITKMAGGDMAAERNKKGLPAEAVFGFEKQPTISLSDAADKRHVLAQLEDALKG